MHNKKWYEFLGEAKRSKWDSAHVVLIRGNKVLLVQRANDDHWMPGKWCLPGGQLDDGETLEQGLKRETLEETGYSIELEDLFYLPSISYKKEHALYACDKISGKLEINHNGVVEHEDAKWISKKEIHSMDTVPGLLDTVKEAFKILGKD